MSSPQADCYFNVGTSNDSSRKFGVKRFPAHKYILATGSTVFYAMFFGGYVESNAESIGKKYALNK